MGIAGYLAELKRIYKNHTHVKIAGHTSEFMFDIYWWTWKTTIYWKNCWNEPIKDVRISIFKMYSYSSWDIECDRLKLVSMGHLKNAWRYYRFTHEYHKWHHFMYGSWDMECNEHNFLSFWTIFWTFNPLTVWKIKILKK